MVKGFPRLSSDHELRTPGSVQAHADWSQQYRITGPIGSGLQKTTCKQSVSVSRFSEDRAFLLSVPLQNMRM